MCVPCSNITDGEPVCDKCFAAFVRTADMPREMYKRYGTFLCARMVPRCPSCMKPGTTSTTWEVPICTKCWQYVHFDIDPDQFMLRSMAVMMSTQPRLGSDALIRDLPDQLLRMICTLSATHDLGPTGAWGMCCVKVVDDVCYNGELRHVDTGQFVCHYCIKKDLMRMCTDTLDSPSPQDPLTQVASRL